MGSGASRLRPGATVVPGASGSLLTWSKDDALVSRGAATAALGAAAFAPTDRSRWAESLAASPGSSNGTVTSSHAATGSPDSVAALNVQPFTACTAALSNPARIGRVSKSFFVV